jgi:hypothetical protein
MGMMKSNLEIMFKKGGIVIRHNAQPNQPFAMIRDSEIGKEVDMVKRGLAVNHRTVKITITKTKNYRVRIYDPVRFYTYGYSFYMTKKDLAIKRGNKWYSLWTEKKR